MGSPGASLLSHEPCEGSQLLVWVGWEHKNENQARQAGWRGKIPPKFGCSPCKDICR